MRQVVYPAALGGCAIGTAALPVRAAEWSLTPIYSASVDYDSNRTLLREPKGSGEGTITVDLKFDRALEDLELSFEPRYALRRYTDRALGNGDDRSVNAGMLWTEDRFSLNASASYLDQSTLVTEPLETGILTGDTHRRTEQAGATWTWNQTERRSLLAQLSYLDVSYRGQSAALLPGYRYPSASLGERFLFNERGSFTLSLFGDRLDSDSAGNSSHEEGLRGELIYQLSELTGIDASLGETARVLAGVSSHGTEANISLTHTLSSGSWVLGYSRSLVPYGVGFLVEQQQVTASISRPLGPYLDSNLTFQRIQNNETAVLLRIASRNYNSLSAGLTWHLLETWSLGAQLQGVRTQRVDFAGETVREWRASVTLTWSPQRRSLSW